MWKVIYVVYLVVDYFESCVNAYQNHERNLSPMPLRLVLFL